jgi:hypothetical protein
VPFRRFLHGVAEDVIVSAALWNLDSYSAIRAARFAIGQPGRLVAVLKPYQEIRCLNRRRFLKIIKSCHNPR